MIPRKSVFALAKALEGVPVLGTLADTPAARAGLRYGDILLEVNGVRTRNVGDYIEAKALRSDGMEMVVFRSGEERTETLIYETPVEPVDAAAIVAELVALRISPADGSDGEGSNGKA